MRVGIVPPKKLKVWVVSTLRAENNVYGLLCPGLLGTSILMFLKLSKIFFYVLLLWILKRVVAQFVVRWPVLFYKTTLISFRFDDRMGFRFFLLFLTIMCIYLETFFKSKQKWRLLENSYIHYLLLQPIWHFLIYR